MERIVDRITGVRVECYSGYRADQRPLRFTLGEKTLQVLQTADQWYGPEDVYFKVIAEDGNTYVLRHNEAADAWTLAAYRSGE